VFVEKEERDGVPFLLFSPIIKHSDHATVDREKQSMESISVRLALFCVLCIASKGYPRL
jgi:hypothetical protein